MDEVADAGIDVLMLCPNIYMLPGWDSDYYPYWREEGLNRNFNEEISPGPTIGLVRDFIVSGTDMVGLSLQRARERNLAFFHSWRMNDGQFLERPTSPTASPFWHEHPEYRIGGPDVTAGDRDIQKRALLCLDFSYEAVRDYKFGFIKELFERYDIDGLELDFLRMPAFFPKEMSFDEKATIMTGFVRRVRWMMDDKKPEIPLCVRIGGTFQSNREIGLDIHTWVEEGLVDMLNLSASMMTCVDIEIERFRADFPDVGIYGEIAHIASHRQLEDGKRERWHIPRAIIHATAHSFLERGADGISFWNYVYSRNHRVEPDMIALHHITDKKFLAKQEKHYHIHSDNSHLFRAIFNQRNWSRQMPARLYPGSSAFISVPLADQNPQEIFKSAILRIYSSREPLKSLPVKAYLDRKPLMETVFHGQLSKPQVDDVGIPKTGENHRDYIVPLEWLEIGRNYFEFHLISGENTVTIEDLELGLFRQTP